MIAGCGSGTKRIVAPGGTNFSYRCSFTDLFKTITEEAGVRMPINETVILSISLDKGFYTYDFSCYGFNDHISHNPTAIIRGWLDFGLPSVQAIDSCNRLQTDIIPKATLDSFFMLRGGCKIFEVTQDGTILSVTFESSNVYTDITLVNKVLNVFKVNTYTNILIP